MTRSPKPPVAKDYKPQTGFLWKWAFAIALVGGIAVWMLSKKLPDPSALTQIRLTILITSVAIGICAISATAHWWTHR